MAPTAHARHPWPTTSGQADAAAPSVRGTVPERLYRTPASRFAGDGPPPGDVPPTLATQDLVAARYWSAGHGGAASSRSDSRHAPAGQAPGSAILIRPAEACYSGGSVKTKGSSALYTPPGFDPAVHDRGHLIARRLGGSGIDPRNITPVFKNTVNQTAQYHGVEKYVYDRIREGGTVYYRVEPHDQPGAEVPFAADYVVATERTGVVHVVVSNMP